MDSGTTIVAAIMILICTIPFVAVSAAAKRRAKQRLREFMDYAAARECTISRHAEQNNTHIGIDDYRNIVFFRRQTPDYLITKEVDLKEITDCRIHEDSRMVSNSTEQFKVVDKIGLVLSYRNRNKPETTLELYNSAYDHLTLAGENTLAAEWAGIINERISALKAG